MNPQYFKNIHSTANLINAQVSDVMKNAKTYSHLLLLFPKLIKHITLICMHFPELLKWINTHLYVYVYLLVPVAFRVCTPLIITFTCIYRYKHTFTCNHQNLSFWTGRELQEHFLTHTSPQTPRCTVWNQTVQVTHKNILQIRFI